MFFFIGGIQPRTVVLDEQPRTCPVCGRPALETKRTDHYLSLFFIPLFPVRRGAPFLECSRCQVVCSEAGRAPDASWTTARGRLCASCGRRLDPAFSFCPYCGRPRPQ